MRVCVYCGSSPGLDCTYVDAARMMGRELAEKGIGLIYGGGSVGVMGEIATAVFEAQFIHRTHRSMVFIEQDLGTLLRKFKGYMTPKVDKAEWVRSLSEGSKKV